MNNRLAWRVAIRDSDLDPTVKHVALTLDTYMDRRGIAWPSKASLAAGTGRAVRTIDRALVRLEQTGFIVAARSRGRRSNLYCASLPNPVTRDTVNSVATNTPTPSPATPTPSPATSNPVTRTIRSRKNLSVEAVPADRARDQDHINLNTDVDPAVVELAHRWITDHRMR